MKTYFTAIFINLTVTFANLNPFSVNHSRGYLAHWLTGWLALALWLTASLLLPGWTWHVTGLLDFWFSGFLDLWLFGSAGSGFHFLDLLFLALLLTTNIYHIPLELIILSSLLFFWKNDDFSPTYICHWSLCVHLVEWFGSQSGSSVNARKVWFNCSAHTALLSVIQFIALMQAKIDSHFCEIRPLKSGLHRIKLDSFHTLFSHKFFYLTIHSVNSWKSFVNITIAIILFVSVWQSLYGKFNCKPFKSVTGVNLSAPHLRIIFTSESSLRGNYASLCRILFKLLTYQTKTYFFQVNTALTIFHPTVQRTLVNNEKINPEICWPISMISRPHWRFPQKKTNL